MIIYRNTRAGFVDDVDNNVLQTRLETAFREKTGSVPADRSVWASEYARFSGALRRSRVSDDIQVAIEYHVSSIGRSRIDVLLAGNDGNNDNALIIELKAWDRAEATPIEGMVHAPVGGGRIVRHPCLQATQYKGLILRFNQDVVEKGVRLHPSAYLFNLHRRTPEPLEDERYGEWLAESRLFLAGDVGALREYIEALIPHQCGNDVLFLLDQGRWRPADELIARVERMLDGNEEFLLLDEQDEAFRIIRHGILDLKERTHRHVFVVEGGPGTGKSVIAVRLMAEVLKNKRMAFFVAPNVAFRNALVESLSRGDRRYREDGQALFRSSWSFAQTDYRRDERSEILIVDEAHRLKEKAYQYKGKSMVEDMVRASRISVFFIDETQRVSWKDTGSIKAIEAAAEKYKARFHPPFQLTAQFRCNGSTGYLNWLDDVLQMRQTGNYENWGDGQYDFRVFNRAEDLYEALKARNTDNKARLIAGYSWEWPTKGRERGTPVRHVQADGLSLPWNYSGESWAGASDGIEQVGCIHTSQGLEFDWVGILIGADLVFRDGKVTGDPAKRAKTDSSLNGWKGELQKAGKNEQARRDVLEKVQEIIKSTYKVLLSRGRKGCYVWCADPGLREYFKGRLDLARTNRRVAEGTAFRIVDRPDRGAYVDHLPVYSLKAAAGYFGFGEAVEATGWIRAEGMGRLNKDMFIAQVKGRSMEPRIRDGAYCVFRAKPQGSRQGKIVLAQCRDMADPETGGSYTVKRYRSEKRVRGDEWEHERIVLEPLNPDYGSIEVRKADDLVVIAEFVAVLGEGRS